MKRRTHPIQRTGKSPYAKYDKREFVYPGWVKERRDPPHDIERTLWRSQPGNGRLDRAARGN